MVLTSRLGCIFSSTSSRSRGSRGVGGGSSNKGAPQKKNKRAKSELHTTRKKQRTVSVKKITREEARTKVLEALKHLGSQKLSKDHGGYNIQSWLKSLTTSLDDFEERVGSSAISDQFREKRREIEKEFSKLQDASQLESEIESVRKEENDIRTKLKEESERIAARLSAIGGEKTSKTRELEEERKNLQLLEEQRRSVGFFSRLMGRSGPPLEPVQKKVRDLEDGLRMLEEETLNLQTVRKSLDGAKEASGGIYEDLWKRLDALESRTVELNKTREARMELLEERLNATEELHRIISELDLKEGGEEEGEGGGREAPAEEPGRSAAADSGRSETATAAK